MIRHSNSFIFSIFIHIALFIGLFFSYEALSVGLKEEKKAPLLCIKLCTLSDKVEVLPPPQIKKTGHIEKVKKKQSQKKKYTKKVLVVNEVMKVNKIVIVDKVLIKSLSEKKPKADTKTSKKVIQEIVKPVKLVKVQVTPEKEYIDENIAKIIALLQENLHYPRRARKRGIQGEVLVRFTLSLNAKVSNIEVLSSSSDVLSRGAVQTIKNIDNKLPKPKQNITFNIPISYTLH